VGVAEEILRVDHLGGEVERVVVQQDRAKDGPFGFEIVRKGAFSDDDALLFSQFVSYFERAISNALFYEKARRFRNFDEDTGLPNAAYLAQRIREECARAGARDGEFAVAVVRIENFAELLELTARTIPACRAFRLPRS